MDFFSLPHLIVVLVIVLVLFGGRRLPGMMGDFAKGIKAFKAGLKDEESANPAQVTPPNPTAAPRAATEPAEHPQEHA